MTGILITEYSEQTKNAQVQADFIKDHEHDYELFDNPESLIITFSEESESNLSEEAHTDDSSNMELDEFSEVSFHEYEDELEPIDSENKAEFDDDELLDSGDQSAMSFKLPGVVDYVEDDLEDEEVDKVDDGSTTDWVNDRDVRHFMPYILEKVNSIPSHDGKSTLGCERAILYLANLNKEISEALRSDPKAYSGISDSGSPLDIESLERIRIKILKDITTLKEHIKTLNKKHKKPTKKKSNDDSMTLIKDGDVPADSSKVASLPKIQLVMTPFERAITGMIINATVSAGKSLEDVYEQLKKQYDISDREELSIFQLLMDMGQPIYKDRGTLGTDGESVDFMKNYFA